MASKPTIHASGTMFLLGHYYRCGRRNSAFLFELHPVFLRPNFKNRPNMKSLYTLLLLSFITFTCFTEACCQPPTSFHGAFFQGKRQDQRAPVEGRGACFFKKTAWRALKNHCTTWMPVRRSWSVASISRASWWTTCRCTTTGWWPWCSRVIRWRCTSPFLAAMPCGS